MFFTLGRLSFALACGLACVAGSASAQTPPTSRAQADALAQARPDLVAQLRQRISGSGLTPDQIRTRLRAVGYPDNILDSYLGTGGDTSAVPGADVFAAVRALGITDSADVAGLLATRGMDRPRPVTPKIDPAASNDPSLSPASAEIFGLSLFRDPSSQFAANLDGPVDAGYRLGPGDQLLLILTGDVEATHSLVVTREGFVVMKDVGQIPVLGLTLAQFEDALYTRLGRVYSGVKRTNASTRFSVSVEHMRTVQVTVTGDVTTPGALRLSAASTAYTALYSAGGPTPIGSMRQVELHRGGQISTFDVYDYVLHGDASHDLRLEQGDVIYLPVHGVRVRLDGQVRRPATYELKPGENLAEVLAMAGGFTPLAGQRRVLVERVVPPAQRGLGGADRTTIDVALGLAGEIPSISLFDGDIVRVPAIAERVRDRIVVQGNVYGPGLQGFVPGLTLEQALRRAGGVQPDAYLLQVNVMRLRPDSTRVLLRATLRDTTGATTAPFPLQPDDEVTVFSRTTFRPQLYTAITGAVNRAGQYPWREGMTLRDLVMMAGGLQEGAYIKEAEIARLPEPRDPAVLARTIRVPFDSTYLFDRTTTKSSVADAPVVPYDNVVILWEPDWAPSRRVAVTGEVKFPGIYTLRNKHERLSDLVARAGGLTTLADPHAAFFSRVPWLVANTGTVATIPLASGGKGPVAVGLGRIRVGVGFDEALQHPGSLQDLILENGDSLSIPPQRQTVEIRGDVNVPTALVLAPGESLEYYIRAAGGVTETANASRAYVVQPNGQIETRRRTLGIFKSDPTPRAGAIVVVPHYEKPPSVQGNSLALIGFFAQLTASLIALVAIVKRG